MGKLLFSNAVLKNIAYLTMFVDHFFAVVFMEIIRQYSMTGADTDMLQQIYSVGRAIGRTSFVLFAYLTVEAFIHTRNRIKYLLRLMLFALVSEVPFDLAFSKQLIDLTSQNIFFTLLISVIVLSGWEWAGKCVRTMHRTKMSQDVCWYVCVGVLKAIQLGTALLGCVAAYYLKADYKYMGVLLIFAFYILRNKPFYIKIVPVACVMYWGILSINLLRYAGAYTTAYLVRYSARELYGLFAFVPIALYDGSKGRQLPKVVCYGFYPVHLLGLCGIAKLVLVS